MADLTTTPSDSSVPAQPAQPDPQIAVLQKQIASLQDFVTQTLYFFNNRTDSATGNGDDLGRSLHIGGESVYTGTMRWAAGTSLSDVILNSWVLARALVGNDFAYQQMHSRDDAGNLSTVFKFTQATQSQIDFDFQTTGKISSTASDAWKQAYAYVEEKSPAVRFDASDCTMDPSAWVFVGR